MVAPVSPNEPTHDLTDDLAFMRDRIVNLFFFGPRGAADREWVLIDAGLAGAAPRIRAAAAARYGETSRPAAIVLTHGHFDHVGALETLAAEWDVPVYAHELELPYITGRSAYPPPDPAVGGGAMALASRLYPRGPVRVGARALALPADGAVPGMPGWRWIATPGHSPGHVSLWREDDRSLIAGDAFVTTKQESMLAVLAQRQELHGPPMYYTVDWPEARRSVERLAALQPELGATGHGIPMRGDRLRRDLDRLAADFDRLAKPRRGRYVEQPALADSTGVIAVPPPVPDPTTRLLAGVGLAAVAGIALATMRRRELAAREERRHREIERLTDDVRRSHAPAPGAPGAADRRESMDELDAAAVRPE